MLKVDYLIVGTGLTGATIARHLADANREVLVVDRRSHVGGNVRDETHKSGIVFNTYGPHYFRTGSERIWDFVRRFAEFYRFEAKLLTYCDKQYWHWPIHRQDLQKLAGSDWTPGFSGTPRNFEEAALSMMPEVIYRKFIKGYTEKQWGVQAAKLDHSLAKRFDVREDGDLRLSRHRYQGIPIGGYSSWVRAMLDGIPVRLNLDYLQTANDYKINKCLIFTGPIDEFFQFELGHLQYRGQSRTHRYFEEKSLLLPGVQVNYPGVHDRRKIRRIEWKHMMPPSQQKKCVGTLITEERPLSPLNSDEYEYPFPDSNNRCLYEAYKNKALSLQRVIICGRLGEYRYFDMDQAIGRAMSIAKKLLEAH